MPCPCVAPSTRADDPRDPRRSPASGGCRRCMPSTRHRSHSQGRCRPPPLRQTASARALAGRRRPPTDDPRDGSRRGSPVAARERDAPGGGQRHDRRRHAEVHNRQQAWIFSDLLLDELELTFRIVCLGDTLEQLALFGQDDFRVRPGKPPEVHIFLAAAQQSVFGEVARDGATPTCRRSRRAGSQFQLSSSLLPRRPTRPIQKGIWHDGPPLGR